MVFSSPRFFFFLVVVLVLLAARYGTDRKKNVLAAASCLFYAAWDVRYLGLLITISVIDYWCAARIARTEDSGVRRRWLLLSVVSNLLILGYFKYCNFFIDNVNAIAGGRLALRHLDILLPAGISFYTFKSMSYTIDVYRKHIEPVRSQLDYTTFVTFFPELIAGPIVRASVFLPQMGRAIGPTRERLAVGASLFLFGLTKKLLIADRLSSVADPVFASPEIYATSTLWLGALAYAGQIYCDFSGYSDMAIGTAKMIGYDLPQNFDMPYISGSVTEFWRRWHITLSTWLRDYLYIPLGGNRKGRFRTYLNLFLTMLLGGLWHGASWNFVLWGALHGIALALHKLYLERVPAARRLPDVVTIPLTFLFVVACWVPFRAATFTATASMLEGMFFLRRGGAVYFSEIFMWASAALVIAHVLGARIARSLGDPAGSPVLGRMMTALGIAIRENTVSGWYTYFGTSTILSSFFIAIWLLTLFFFAAAQSSPFIYFQF
jgi:alginate O-acetyltransferase complex protein AlgI